MSTETTKPTFSFTVLSHTQENTLQNKILLLNEKYYRRDRFQTAQFEWFMNNRAVVECRLQDKAMLEVVDLDLTVAIAKETFKQNPFWFF